MRNILLILTLGSFFACGNEISEQEIVDYAIVNHGSKLFDKSLINFDFRGKSYGLYRDNHNKKYTRGFDDDSLGQVRDTLVNSVDLTRYVNGVPVSLTNEWSKKYASSINSVLYFFQLPYGLNDPAVQKKLLPKNIVNGHMYHKVQVTFTEEGGGDDFKDVFVYWINEASYTIDYLAYTYHTEGGGLRFREATNRRNIKGLIVQDYINYKPQDSTIAVYDLDELFETRQLDQLSVIENKNVSVISLSEH